EKVHSLVEQTRAFRVVLVLACGLNRNCARIVVNSDQRQITGERDDRRERAPVITEFCVTKTGVKSGFGVVRLFLLKLCKILGRIFPVAEFHVSAAELKSGLRVNGATERIGVV